MGVDIAGGLSDGEWGLPEGSGCTRGVIRGGVGVGGGGVGVGGGYRRGSWCRRGLPEGEWV